VGYERGVIWGSFLLRVMRGAHTGRSDMGPCKALAKRVPKAYRTCGDREVFRFFPATGHVTCQTNIGENYSVSTVFIVEKIQVE